MFGNCPGVLSGGFRKEGCRGRDHRFLFRHDVLEDSTLFPFSDGSGFAGGGHPAGDSCFDPSPKAGRQIHRSLAPHTTGLPGHSDDPPLSAELPSGRLDLNEIPHVRANPDGAVWLLVDAWLI